MTFCARLFVPGCEHGCNGVWRCVCAGVDLAWSANGYVYHTQLDTAERVPRSALQRTGDNVLALTHGNHSLPILLHLITDSNTHYVNIGSLTCLKTTIQMISWLLILPCHLSRYRTDNDTTIPNKALTFKSQDRESFLVPKTINFLLFLRSEPDLKGTIPSGKIPKILVTWRPILTALDRGTITWKNNQLSCSFSCM